MSIVAGDFTEITFNHPTLGSGVFLPKSGEDSSLDLGGFRSDDDAQMIAGNGGMIDKMNRNRWFFESQLAGDMNTAGDLEKLTALAESPVQADWTFTHINGTVYGAKGKPVGDIKQNPNTGALPIKVSGGGKAKKIVG